ncbi:hypothetical protein QQ73_21040, partial [Candidatus Endoriftia persephone str. Guaymas]|nr:hypothetical protein [Candidatus Endoriftia persephone str. Guaymas]
HVGNDVNMDDNFYYLELVVYVSLLWMAYKVNLFRCYKFEMLSPWGLFVIVYMLLYGVGSIRWIAEENANIARLISISTVGFLMYLLGSLFHFGPWGLKGGGWFRKNIIFYAVVILAISSSAFIVFTLKVG